MEVGAQLVPPLDLSSTILVHQVSVEVGGQLVPPLHQQQAPAGAPGGLDAAPAGRPLSKKLTHHQYNVSLQGR